MPKKKILVIAPVLAQAEDVRVIASSLSFLQEAYHIDVIDPLSIDSDEPLPAYYQLWERIIHKQMGAYDAFFGFSFGGVILQQCFPLLSSINKPIILFSTPTRADAPLTEALGMVIHLCRQNRVKDALQLLYDRVYHPEKPPVAITISDNSELAAQRLIGGLTRVLQTDSTRMLKEAQIPYLHLIGERSLLVNTGNVIAGVCARLAIVPGAGMRVLEANPSWCQKIIWEALNL